MLCLRVMASFAGRCRFPAPCGELFMFPLTKGTIMASFQLKMYSDRSNNTRLVTYPSTQGGHWQRLLGWQLHTCRPLPRCWPHVQCCHSHRSTCTYICTCVLYNSIKFHAHACYITKVTAYMPTMPILSTSGSPDSTCSHYSKVGHDQQSQQWCIILTDHSIMNMKSLPTVLHFSASLIQCLVHVVA